MSFRSFLTGFFLCLVPLLLLTSTSYWNAVGVGKSELSQDLKSRLGHFDESLKSTLSEQQDDLEVLAQSNELQHYLSSRGVNRQNPPTASPNRADQFPLELRALFDTILKTRGHLVSVTCYDRYGPAFSVERSLSNAGVVSLIFRTSDFNPGLPKPDSRVWGVREITRFDSPLTIAPFGASLSCTIPVFAQGMTTGEPQGALVGALNIDTLLTTAAKAVGDEGVVESQRLNLTVLDSSGGILFHRNDALRHQPVTSALPSFNRIASAMLANEAGAQTFNNSNERVYFAVYAPLSVIGAAAAVYRDQSSALTNVRRAALISTVSAIVIALFAAFALARYSQRWAVARARGKDATITEGEFKGLEAKSGAATPSLTGDTSSMTDLMREQLARETEARQFESFVRLSAMLTHDLKNAIEALSLIVGNMGQHFDNPRFRADTMKSLKIATEKLKAMVVRISNPVETLSGEHKRPKPTDLVLLVQKVVSLIAGPVREKYHLELKLPHSLLAMADADRIEKVMENLAINALEAMGEKGGTLTFEAGPAAEGKVYFSVADTGPGIEAEFLERRLFRPFATTRKNGVGLGLYTCREVVRANAGSIVVESKVGVGTTFRVVLPSAAVEKRN